MLEYIVDIAASVALLAVGAFAHSEATWYLGLVCFIATLGSQNLGAWRAHKHEKDAS